MLAGNLAYGTEILTPEAPKVECMTKDCRIIPELDRLCKVAGGDPEAHREKFASLVAHAQEMGQPGVWIQVVINDSYLRPPSNHSRSNLTLNVVSLSARTPRAGDVFYFFCFPWFFVLIFSLIFYF